MSKFDKIGKSVIREYTIIFTKSQNSFQQLFHNIIPVLYFFGGVTIICAVCVPGSIIQGAPGNGGEVGKPVDSEVAYGI